MPPTMPNVFMTADIVSCAVMIWLAVAVGGALGSMARHGVNVWFAHVLERAVPWATAAVNLSGSLLIGLLAALIATGRLQLSPPARTFVFVGILGGFTTFSSFMLDTFTLGHGGEHALAFWNVALQTALGLVAVWLGFKFGHAIG
jgi:CrcB protein